jgi:hypothetical protein
MQARRRARREFPRNLGPEVGRNLAALLSQSTQLFAVRTPRGTMDIRIVGVALVGSAVVLAGCSDKSEPAAAPTTSAAQTSTAAPAPKASDEDQVRDVLTQEGVAFSVWNFEKVGELTCPQFRDQAMSTEGAVPPMSAFPADAAASLGPQGFADQVGAQFAGASNEALLAVANAVIGQDEGAYKAAMLDVVKQSMSIQLTQIDNIVVKGDSATADVTLTQRIGKQPPETRTTPATLARIDGKWFDCTPPDQP